MTAEAATGVPVIPTGSLPVLGVRRRVADDAGSATVVMLAVVAAVLMLTVSGLLLASAVLASHRARVAADLAALAAAGALIQGAPPRTACLSAARVAAANLGRVQWCTVVGTEVRLSTAVPAAIRGMGVATARSKAGADPSASASAAGRLIP